MNDHTYETMPPHVLENLKLFAQHKDCACANCGYTGQMGVSKEETDKKMKTWITRFVTAMIIYAFGINYYYPSGKDSYIPYLLGIPFGMILIILMPPKFETLCCPNCNLLQTK